MFRDYDQVASEGNKQKMVMTPVKRKSDDVGTSMDLPLTPPPTVQRALVDVKIELVDEITAVNGNFARRRKRRKIG